jgi:hypothetical protein
MWQSPEEAADFFLDPHCINRCGRRYTGGFGDRFTDHPARQNVTANPEKT